MVTKCDRFCCFILISLLLIPLAAYAEDVPAGMGLPETVYSDPNTKLYDGVLFSDPAQVKEALQEKADPNYKKTKRPMIGWAAQNGSAEVVKALVEGKADINMVDGIGQTALMRAAEMNRFEAAKVLIDAKAEVNRSTKDGSTALTMAIDSGNTEMVDALLKAGAKVDIKTASGESPLTLAKYGDKQDIIALLKKNGATE